MNEELQKQLAESIKDFADSIGAAKDFAVDQAPDVIQQFLLWGIVDNVGGMIILALTIWLSFQWIFKWSDQTKECGEDSISKIWAMGIGGFAAFCSALAFLVCLFTLLKIIVAPKVYLLSVVASLIK